MKAVFNIVTIRGRQLGYLQIQETEVYVLKKKKITKAVILLSNPRSNMYKNNNKWSIDGNNLLIIQLNKDHDIPQELIPATLRSLQVVPQKFVTTEQ